jgi:hypothetical protein
MFPKYIAPLKLPNDWLCREARQRHGCLAAVIIGIEFSFSALGLTGSLAGLTGAVERSGQSSWGGQGQK